MNGEKLYSLLKEQEKNYSVKNLGCGMLLYEEVVDGYWRCRYLLNENKRTAFEIVGRDLFLKAFTVADVETDLIAHFEYSRNALRLAAHYPFSIYPFKKGVAYVSWTLHPDGMYFRDDDGYGMEPCDEEAIGAYIDTDCRVLVKFRDIGDGDTRMRLYEEALKRMNLK